jgi:hypothetical protein
MWLPLIMSAVVVIPAPTPNASHLCRDALQMKNVNLPPDSTSADTDVEHVALVYNGDSFAGEIYVTRDGDMWYQLGTPRADVDEKIGRAIASTLGVSNQYHEQRFYRIQPSALEALMRAGNSTLSCY